MNNNIILLIIISLLIFCMLYKKEHFSFRSFRKRQAAAAAARLRKLKSWAAKPKPPISNAFKENNHSLLTSIGSGSSGRPDCSKKDNGKCRNYAWYGDMDSKKICCTGKYINENGTISGWPSSKGRLKQPAGGQFGGWNKHSKRNPRCYNGYRAPNTEFNKGKCNNAMRRTLNEHVFGTPYSKICCNIREKDYENNNKNPQLFLEGQKYGYETDPMKKLSYADGAPSSSWRWGQKGCPNAYRAPDNSIMKKQCDNKKLKVVANNLYKSRRAKTVNCWNNPFGPIDKSTIPDNLNDTQAQNYIKNNPDLYIDQLSKTGDWVFFKTTGTIDSAKEHWKTEGIKESNRAFSYKYGLPIKLNVTQMNMFKQLHSDKLSNIKLFNEFITNYINPERFKNAAIEHGMTTLGGAAATYWHHHIWKVKHTKLLDTKLSFHKIPDSLTDTQTDQFIKEHDFFNTNTFWANAVNKHGSRWAGRYYWKNYGKNHPTRKYTFSRRAAYIPDSLTDTQTDQFIKEHDFFITNKFWSDAVKKHGSRWAGRYYWKNYGKKHPTRKYTFSIPKYINEEQAKIFVENNPDLKKKFTIEKYWSDISIKVALNNIDFFNILWYYISRLEEFQDSFFITWMTYTDEQLKHYKENNPDIFGSTPYKHSDKAILINHYQTEGFKDEILQKSFITKLCPKNNEKKAYFETGVKNAIGKNTICCLAGNLSSDKETPDGISPGSGWSKNYEGCKGGYRAPDGDDYKKSCNNTAILSDHDKLDSKIFVNDTLPSGKANLNYICCNNRPNNFFSSGSGVAKGCTYSHPYRARRWADMKISCILGHEGRCNSKSHPYLGDAINIENAKKSDKFKTRFYPTLERDEDGELTNTENAGFNKYWKCPKRDIQACSKACDIAKKKDIKDGELTHDGDLKRWTANNMLSAHNKSREDGESYGLITADTPFRPYRPIHVGDPSGNFRKDTHTADVIWGEEMLRKANQTKGYVCGMETDHKLKPSESHLGDDTWKCNETGIDNPKNRSDCRVRKVFNTRVCEKKFFKKAGNRSLFNKLAIYNIDDLYKAGIVNKKLYDLVKEEEKDVYNEKYLLKPWKYHTVDINCKSWCATNIGLGRLTRDNVNRTDYKKCIDGCRWAKGAAPLQWTVTVVTLAITLGGSSVIAGLIGGSSKLATTLSTVGNSLIQLKNATLSMKTLASLHKVASFANSIKGGLALSNALFPAWQMQSTIQKVGYIILQVMEKTAGLYNAISVRVPSDADMSMQSFWKDKKKKEPNTCIYKANGTENCEKMNLLTKNAVTQQETWKGQYMSTMNDELALRDGIPNGFCLPNGATKEYCASGKVGSPHLGKGYHDTSGYYLRYKDSRKDTFNKDLIEAKLYILNDITLGLQDSTNDISDDERIKTKKKVLKLLYMGQQGRSLCVGKVRRKMEELIKKGKNIPLSYRKLFKHTGINKYTREWKNGVQEGNVDRLSFDGKLSFDELNSAFKNLTKISNTEFSKEYYIDPKVEINIDQPDLCNIITHDTSLLYVEDYNSDYKYFLVPKSEYLNPTPKTYFETELSNFEKEHKNKNFKEIKATTNELLKQYISINKELAKRGNLKDENDAKNYFWIDDLNKYRPDDDKLLSIESSKFGETSPPYNNKVNGNMTQTEINKNNADFFWNTASFNKKLAYADINVEYNPDSVNETDIVKMGQLHNLKNRGIIKKIGENSVVKEINCGSYGSGTRDYRCMP